MNASIAQEGQLLAELRRAGFRVDSIWEWINNPAPAGAQEILLKYLELATDEKLIEGLSRALTQKRFKQAVPVLLRKFGEVENDLVRWAIGNAIAYLGFQRKDWQLILHYASSPRFGRGRQNLVWRLHRVKLPEVESLLLQLIDDPDVDAFAAIALGYCGGLKAAERLRAIDLEGRTPLLRQEIPKALRRIERRARAA